MHRGWIKLHRSIIDNWIYKEKRKFSKFEAWLDILLFANHKDNKFLFEGSLLEVKRGQILTSEVKLANKWEWSRKKVRNFLKLLEDDGMIVKMVIPNKGVIIEIVNYDDYQKDTSEDTSQSIDNTCIEENKEQQKEQHENNRGTTQEQQRNTNKNDKNVKNENKNIYTSVIEYLNKKAGTKYRGTTKKTQSCINARINEGFKENDFYIVIDNKVNEWQGTDMEKYLRPETLFGNKFEGYLNQKSKEDNQNNNTKDYNEWLNNRKKKTVL